MRHYHELNIPCNRPFKRNRDTVVARLPPVALLRATGYAESARFITTPSKKS